MNKDDVMPDQTRPEGRRRTPGRIRGQWLGALVVVLLTSAGQLEPGRAPAGVSAPASAHRLYLPLTLNDFDAGYETPFGVAMFGDISAQTGLNQVQAAGAGWVMTNVQWYDIQPVEGGPYQWAAYDAKFSNAAAAGLRLYLLFDGNPGWVSAAPRGPVPADKLDDLVAVVQALAERYNGQNGLPRIDYWSFYGEPDHVLAWGTQGAAYAAMLAQVAPVVRAANPHARVLIGGIAYDRFAEQPPPFVEGFLGEVLAALNALPGGASAYIDAVAFHYYPISTPRWPTLRDKAVEILGILAQHGAAHLPLIVPEMSMWSDAQGGSDAQTQARRLTQFYVQGIALRIRQLYWFQVFDLHPPFPTSEQGLFPSFATPDALNSPKLSYFAYQTVARELERARYLGPLKVSGVEGHVFRRGAVQVTVAWGTTASTVPVDFAQSCVRRVQLLGAVDLVTDGGAGDLDGAANGRVRLPVAPDEPVYATTCP